MALTDSDLKAIQNLIKITLDEVLEAKLDEKLDEKLAHFPTKEEYFDREDKMMGELKTIREEVTFMSDLLSDHTDRIVSLEKIHPRGKHPASLQA